jgi:hypothetical protein
MQIVYLGKTQVDMKVLLSLVKRGLNKSLKIDDLRLSPDHPLAQLATLTDLKGVACNFSNLGSLLRHEHYTYLVHCKERDMFELVWESGLAVTTDPDNEIGIVSGNLQQWRSAILDGCSESALDSFREFTNLILVDLETRGLSQIFSNYRKAALKDSTFKLLEK